MLTQKGANTHVVGIHGNFDQAQSAVKAMFNDKALAETMDAAGYQFSSANSINIGRLVPQIVYYVYAYSMLFAQGAVAKDEEINIVVPTGNFGNILAAFYAKNMDFPLQSLSALQTRTRCFTISSRQESMIKTESLSSQIHHPWIFSSLQTLRDSFTVSQEMMQIRMRSLWLHLQRRANTL